MKRTRWVVLVLPVTLAVSGCITSRMTGARAQFVAEMTCPADRVAVRPMPVLAPADPPPLEVAADPDRAAMWRAKDAERRAAKEKETYYEATGCGQSRIYHCYYCVEMPGETDCGMAPNCDADASCRESASRPGYVTCDTF